MCKDKLSTIRPRAHGSLAGDFFRLIALCGLTIVFLALVSGSAKGSMPQWQQKVAPLMTRWSKEVSPTNVYPEYPRPQMVRDEWQSLNGLWQLAFCPANQATPVSFPDAILVPFPVESALSGVMRPLERDEALWYRRQFTMPPAWRGQRILLHFDAVNWMATVMVNGFIIGTHRGGYDPFTLDISKYLKWNDKDTITIAVMNPKWGDQPRGKQSPSPGGIFYSRASGIWQTVWIEPVPSNYIQHLRLSPDLDAGWLRVQAFSDTAETNTWIEAKASVNGTVVGTGRGVPDKSFNVILNSIRRWKPSDPFLYDLEVTLHQNNQILDRVRSYFGMRKISMEKDASGHTRMMINDEPLFQIGVLDQGYWPDGIYTAPTDGAMRFDIEAAKNMGFNLIRKHQKIEPERWYYWCDRLGMLVWQDMPGGGNSSDATQRQFETELRRMIDSLYNHPCVVMWNLFNLGWGEFDSDRIIRYVKETDPERLVDCAEAWNFNMLGDVEYLSNRKQAPFNGSKDHVLIDGFGFVSWEMKVPGHSWTQASETNQGELSEAEILNRYRAGIANAMDHYKNDGISGTVFSQLTDVENNFNGLLTYDRAKFKVPANVMRSVNQCDDFSKTNETFLHGD